MQIDGVRRAIRIKHQRLGGEAGASGGSLVSPERGTIHVGENKVTDYITARLPVVLSPKQ